MGKHWYDLDNLVQDVEDGFHDAERGAGKVIDAVAHGAGAGLDAVGLRSVGDAVRHWGDSVADQLGATPDEKSLGQTHDPRELVHGDPGAMRDRAGKLEGFAQDFENAGVGLRGISVGNFSGRMANEYHQAVETEYPKWLKASDASKKAAAALHNLADAVEWAQSQAAEAIRLWDEAEQKHNDWQQKHDDYVSGASDTDPGQDPGPALREHANDVLKAARAHRNSAAASAASSLNDAAGEAPPLPSASERLLDNVQDAADTAGMFDSHMVVGLAEAGTGLVKLARTVNPTDPYNLAHPAQYGANAAAVGAGLVKMAAHPDELVKGFIGTGWKDDPGQATGALMANLIPFGPKGAGVAKSVLSDALKGMRGGARGGMEGAVRDVAAHTRVPGSPHVSEPPRAVPTEHVAEPSPAASVRDAPAPAERPAPVEHTAPPAEHAPPPTEHASPPTEHGPAPAEHAPPPAERAPAEHTAPPGPDARPEPPGQHGPLEMQPPGHGIAGEHPPTLDRGPAPEPVSEPVRAPENAPPPANTEPAGPHGGNEGGPGPSGPPSETVKPLDAPHDPHPSTPVESASAPPHSATEVEGRPHAADERGAGNRPPGQEQLPGGQRPPSHNEPVASPAQPHPGRAEPAEGARTAERGLGESGRPTEAQPKATPREPAPRDASPTRETAPREAPSEKPTGARPSEEPRPATAAARASEATVRDESRGLAKAGSHEPVGDSVPRDGHAPDRAAHDLTDGDPADPARGGHSGEHDGHAGERDGPGGEDGGDGGDHSIEDRESDEPARDWPSDDSGYRITDDDLKFLGLDPEQVGWWQRFEAPLGMTPAQFKEFTGTLNDALAADGLDASQVDIRLQGSSAQFFSGPHKNFPTEHSLAEQPEALARLREWMGDRPESDRPARIPFDAMERLGVRDAEGELAPLSDYDVQLSSDAMVDKAREAWEAMDPSERSPQLMHPKYDFADKDALREAFPALLAWKERWEEVLGREVAPALFGSDGPPDKSGVGSGISTHFRDRDWMINQPGGPRS